VSSAAAVELGVGCVLRLLAYSRGEFGVDGGYVRKDRHLYR
jgi:hypothetical protein